MAYRFPNIIPVAVQSVVKSKNDDLRLGRIPE
jgi:hypothetical protein